VKKSTPNETCQVVIVPRSDKSAGLHGILFADDFDLIRFRAMRLIVMKFAGALSVRTPPNQHVDSGLRTFVTNSFTRSPWDVWQF
jgi:hypothetical protein